MKKVFISAILIAGAVTLNAQEEYFINDNFVEVEEESSWAITPYQLPLVEGGTIEMTRIHCNFEAVPATELESEEGIEANDGKEGTGHVALRVGDSGRTGAGTEEVGGYIEFTIPAGTSVGTIRIHVRAKSSNGNRQAELLINGVSEELSPATLDLTNFHIFTYEVDETLEDDMTVRVRSNNDAGPIMINSIQVTLYDEGPGTNISNATAESTDLNVFPNPVKDELNVTNIAEGVKNINIYNLQGALVMTQQVNGLQAISFSVAELAQGVYIVQAGDKAVKIEKVK